MGLVSIQQANGERKSWQKVLGHQSAMCHVHNNLLFRSSLDEPAWQGRLVTSLWSCIKFQCLPKLGRIVGVHPLAVHY